jgi:hypothetical protein
MTLAWAWAWASPNNQSIGVEARRVSYDSWVSCVVDACCGIWGPDENHHRGSVLRIQGPWTWNTSHSQEFNLVTGTLPFSFPTDRFALCLWNQYLYRLGHSLHLIDPAAVAYVLEECCSSCAVVCCCCAFFFCL